MNHPAPPTQTLSCCPFCANDDIRVERSDNEFVLGCRRCRFALTELHCGDEDNEFRERHLIGRWNTRADKALIADTDLPTNPQVADGRIWDGGKWLEVSPSMEAYAVVALSKENEQVQAHVRDLVEALTFYANEWKVEIIERRGDPDNNNGIMPVIHRSFANPSYALMDDAGEKARAAVQKTRGP